MATTPTNYQDNQLATISEDAKPPETRISTGSQALAIYQNLWQADSTRAWRRSLVKGLVDGNPPYNNSDLVNAGVAHRCNVNWRTSEAYLNNASGAFYDLFNEAPTYAVVKINKGTPDEARKYSRIVTEHFDWLLRYEPKFDYNMQISQGEMTLYGCGPLMFVDEFEWCPLALLSEQLKVQDRAKSDTNYWELSVVEVNYNADQLWSMIRDREAAEARGWNVSAAQQAIMNASPDYQKGGVHRYWEWHQQQLKNGSICYSTEAKTISVAYLLFREFAKKGEKQGKISQVIINRDTSAQREGAVFLYQKIGRYKDWNEVIHPMYYDRGGGGFHHSVTGLGVKMYSALEYVNRLRCANADKAFSAKLMFKPNTATNADQFSLEQHGEYMVLGEGYEPVQMPMQGMMEEGLVFDRFISDELNSNLSQYRKSEGGDEPKSHITATKTRYDAANEARLAKTQNVRYYAQLDPAYFEMFRRAVEQAKSGVGVGADRAKKFVERCVRDGVPKECLTHVENVKASRVVGQGSEFMRQQSVEFLFATVLPMLPESGRFKLIQDVIAARAGQSAVQAYAPDQESEFADNQFAMAVLQVASMKTGVPAVVTESQSSPVFLGVFIDAATKAIQSLEQGAQPPEVAAFLELCGQAIATHLQRLSADPTRKELVKAVTAKLKEIGSVLDKLTEQMQAQQQEQQAMAQQEQEQNSELAMKWGAMEGKQQLSTAKTRFQIENSAIKTQAGLKNQADKAAQELILSDARAATEIRQAEEKHRSDLNGKDKGE